MKKPLIQSPSSNLSVAWAKTFLDLMTRPGGVCHPSVVIISGLEAGVDIEDLSIRSRLDLELKLFNQKSCATVAGTIFPSSMWNPKFPNDMDVLFERYQKAWPGIARCEANRKGVYFRRLTAYQPKVSDGTAKSPPVNQLKSIIEGYNKGNHRVSAMQAAIFDPSRDHSTQPILGFPCLQQIAFTPVGDGGLSITGFYAKQLHFEKSYGNYLGLYELGRFVAKQLGLKLVQVVCIAGCLEFSDKKTKRDLLGLADDIGKILEANQN